MGCGALFPLRRASSTRKARRRAPVVPEAAAMARLLLSGCAVSALPPSAEDAVGRGIGGGDRNTGSGRTFDGERDGLGT